MKQLKTIVCIWTIAISLFVAAIIAQNNKEESPVAEEPPLPIVVLEEPVPVVVVEPTFDSEISRLALEYGIDEVLARRIISCESQIYKRAKNENLDKNGNVWSSDHGYWQINDFYHEESAKKMGLDIYNWQDNLEYGAYLMKIQGTAPWSASRYCWDI